MCSASMRKLKLGDVFCVIGKHRRSPHFSFDAGTEHALHPRVHDSPPSAHGIWQFAVRVPGDALQAAPGPTSSLRIPAQARSGAHASISPSFGTTE